MLQQLRHRVVTRLQGVGWVYFTNNFYIDSVSDMALAKPALPLELVPITPQNCARVLEFREADRCAEYARKIGRGEVGYFAMSDGATIGSIWATINRTKAPVVWRGHMRLQPNEAVMHDGVTADNFRGKGVAAFMVVSLAIALLNEHRVGRILADVNVSNRPSLRMMAKTGLRPHEAVLAVSAFGGLICQIRMPPRV